MLNLLKLTDIASMLNLLKLTDIAYKDNAHVPG